MHKTVAHYASISYPIPNAGVAFLYHGKWMPSMKLCPVCEKVKKFARSDNSFCSRSCASIDMWAKRRE